MMTRRILLLAGLLLAIPSAALAQPSLIGTVDATGKTVATSVANPVPILGSVTGTVTTADQKGAGAVTATTLRTVTATDSPDVTILSTLSTVLATLGAAIPPLGLMAAASDGTFLRALKAVDLDSGAGTDYAQGVGMLLRAAGGAAFASGGAGAVDAGTLRVVPASISSSTPLALVEVTAAEVEVLPAMAGRRAWGIQIFADADGPICCSLGASTSACANPAFMLDQSPDATHAGGSKEDSGYSGAVTCRAMGAYGVNVSRWQY
jgi:hypothetical protein